MAPGKQGTCIQGHAGDGTVPDKGPLSGRIFPKQLPLSIAGTGIDRQEIQGRKNASRCDAETFCGLFPCRPYIAGIRGPIGITSIRGLHGSQRDRTLYEAAPLALGERKQQSGTEIGDSDIQECRYMKRGGRNCQRTMPGLRRGPARFRNRGQRRPGKKRVRLSARDGCHSLPTSESGVVTASDGLKTLPLFPCHISTGGLQRFSQVGELIQKGHEGVPGYLFPSLGFLP